MGGNWYGKTVLMEITPAGAEVAARAGGQRAQDVLQRWWNTRVLPVETAGVAQALGVEVHRVELPADLLGRLLPGHRAQIHVGTGRDLFSQRYGVAHLLGCHEYTRGEKHLEVARHGPPDELFHYARGFAHALLLPRQPFAFALTCHLTDEELQQRFQVSKSVLQYQRGVLEMELYPQGRRMTGAREPAPSQT